MAFQLIDFILPNLQIFSEVYTRPGDGHEPFEPRERRGSVVLLKRQKNRFFPRQPIRFFEDSDALDASELPVQTTRSACHTARPHPSKNALLSDVYCLALSLTLSGRSHAVASHSGAQQQPRTSHV